MDADLAAEAAVDGHQLILGGGVVDAKVGLIAVGIRVAGYFDIACQRQLAAVNF